MLKTLKISFSLKNTYQVNTILYSLKQIPLLKKCLPERLYQVRGLKVLANIGSALWELCSIFLGKALYFAVMIWGMSLLYTKVPQKELFLHILICLTVIGGFANTYLFNPSRDKYYAMILMRMDAREYTLVNYGYAILKVLAGFLVLTSVFGKMSGVPLWECLLGAFFVPGFKLTIAAGDLWIYEKWGRITKESNLSKWVWIGMVLLLFAAYAFPAMGVLLPESASAVILAAGSILGCCSLWKIGSFRLYQEMCKELLANFVNPAELTNQIVRAQSDKLISEDTGIQSTRKGFEYLNELFMKRHRKLLWKSSVKLALISGVLILAGIFVLFLKPETRPNVNRMLLTFLPYFLFIMYAINRGTGFTRALFLNCDHSLLTYSFYKEPRFILKLFQIRLREIVKVNLLPALVIGTGLGLLLYLSGGTDNWMHYVVILISILCMSIFFSVHYLTIYYLLQPYNAATEMKSGMYQVISTVTYLVCFYAMKLRMDTLMFGGICILFSVFYSLAACVLVYHFAPKTFRIRN